jgi:hypothetical protein
LDDSYESAESNPSQKLPIGTVIVTTPNKLATIRLRAIPLPKNVTSLLESSSTLIRTLYDQTHDKKTSHGSVDSDTFLDLVETTFQSSTKDDGMIEADAWNDVTSR